MPSEEVSFGRVVAYGVEVSGFVLLLALLSGGLSWAGTMLGGEALLAGGQAAAGKVFLAFLLFIFAGVIFIGGLLGILYKVIADGVKEGTEMAGLER